MSTPPPTPQEVLERALEHGAILQCALRHLAAAWHRQHSEPSDPSWVHCADRFCQMAHDAVEGRYEARSTSPHGTVISLRPKRSA